MAAIALTYTAAAIAQSQRMVLVEEFTQASCIPCAAQNPAFNALLNLNTAKVVPIKYQTSWPGADPMNAQNSFEIGARTSYNGITAVPNVRQDGGIVGSGNPSAYSQTAINSEYAVPSPFTINLSHTFSYDYDSVFITCQITASMPFTTAGPLKAHVAMLEQAIHFSSSAGSNGEKDFYYVMRKMYPNAYGTTLPLTWTTGQSQTITFAVPIPSYIYDKGQIGIAAFIQSDNDRKVHQAAYSAAQPFPLDAGAVAIADIPFSQCDSSFTPVVTLKNFGLNTLTSCSITYKTDGGSSMTYPWSGMLAPGADTVVTLPVQHAGLGTHTFTVFTAYPNGLATPDANPANNQVSQSFRIFGPVGAAAPATEGFEASTFPPSGWVLDNFNSGSATWSRENAGGFMASAASARINFYASPQGETDELYAKSADLSTVPADLTFSLAYTPYAAENDRIEVKASADCGLTWTTVYNKAGATLATTSPVIGGPFTPTLASDWRTETVDLSAFTGSADVMIKFVATSDYGNNAYIDDINLSPHVSTGIDTHAATNTVSVYPNPVTGHANIQFQLSQPGQVMITLVNTAGQKVLQKDLGTVEAGDHNILLNAESLANGLYFLTINAAGNSSSKKIIIRK